MIQSMTGFASKTITITKDKDQKAHISLQLKSLNSRYFEVSTKLPHPLSHLETEFIKLFKKALHRGHLHFSVHLDNPSIFKGAVQPAIDTALDYVAAMKKIKSSCKIDDPITLEILVRLPNIFHIEEQGLDQQSIKVITKAMQDLITAVIHEREKEGKLLKKDLEKRISFMEKEIKAIEKRFQEQVIEQKEKLNKLLHELEGNDSELATARKSALYTVLEKIDIHEEIVRFASHLENLGLLLQSDEIEKGKRGDFILQELAREINTITAKCSDARISQLAINIKVEIEKAREQVQNIV